MKVLNEISKISMGNIVYLDEFSKKVYQGASPPEPPLNLILVNFYTYECHSLPYVIQILIVENISCFAFSKSHMKVKAKMPSPLSEKLLKLIKNCWKEWKIEQKMVK